MPLSASAKASPIRRHHSHTSKYTRLQTLEVGSSSGTMSQFASAAKPIGRLTARCRLFYLNYERNPEPLNVATQGPTIGIVSAQHPFQIRTARRLRQVDCSKLHWRVGTPVDLSKSAFVRDRMKRRVREAFTAELKERGWERDGSVRADGGLDGKMQERRLKGAALLSMPKDAAVLDTSAQEVREHARWAVSKLVEWQSEHGFEKRRRDSKKREDHGKSYETRSVKVGPSTNVDHNMRRRPSS